jgi:hypothetical protein
MSLERALDLAPLPTDSQGGFTRRIPRRRLLALVAVLFLAGRGFLQGDQQNAALIVSGYPGQVPLTQIYGRAYVAASRGSHKGWFVWRVPHDAAASFWLDLSFQSI